MNVSAQLARVPALRTLWAAQALPPSAMRRREERFVEVLQPPNHSVDLEIASLTLPSARTKSLP